MRYGRTRGGRIGFEGATGTVMAGVMTGERQFTHPEILAVVRGVSLAILLSALDQTIVVPAVPHMARDFHAISHVSWIVSAYLLTGTAATPIFGKLSDVFGRRALLQPAIILFVIASLGCAASGNLAEMLAWRAVQGIGGAGLITVAQTAIADVAPPRQRGKYQIYMSGMWGIASIGGPVLGGFLADSLSWRWIFWVNLPVGVWAYVWAGRALKNLPVKAPGGQKIDLFGAVFLVGTITAWLVLLSSGGRDFAWLSTTATALAAAGLAGLAALLWQESRVKAPMLPLHIFGNGVVLGGLLLSFTNSLCTFGATFLLPLYYQYVRHGTAQNSGAFMTPFLLAFVVMSFAGGHISRWLGRTKPTMLAALTSCLAGLLLLATMRPATPLPLCLLYMIILGGGIGLVQPNITVAIQNAAARPDIGAATGTMLLFRATGGAAGATLAGTVMLAAGFPAAFLSCALAASVAVGIAALMRDSALRTTN